MNRNILTQLRDHEEIKEVYVHRFLFVLAFTLISVFLPIYVFNKTNSLTTVMVFFAVYSGTGLLTSLPVAKLAATVGYKKTALVSSPFTLVFYNLMRTLESSNPMIYLFAVIGGISFNMYWIGMNAEISKSSNKEERNKETGAIFLIPILASIASPYIGGWISEVYGFNTLFLTVIILIGASFIPFIFSFEHFEKNDYTLNSFFKKEKIVEFKTFFLQGFTFAGYFELWPLYVGYLVSGSMVLGIVGSLREIGGAIISVYLGKKMFKTNRYKFLNNGVILYILTALAITFTQTPMIVFIISFLNGVSMRNIEIPIFAGILGKAKEGERLGYFAFREFAIAGGRVTLFVILAILFHLLDPLAGFRTGFIIISVAVLCLRFTSKKVELEKN